MSAEGNSLHIKSSSDREDRPKDTSSYLYEDKVPVSQAQTALLSFLTHIKSSEPTTTRYNIDKESTGSYSSMGSATVDSLSKIIDEEQLKRQLNRLIAVKENEVMYLRENQKIYGSSFIPNAITPRTELSFLVEKYSMERFHPSDKKVTASPYKRLNKKTGISHTNNRYIKISMSQAHPWETYQIGLHEISQDLVKCGI